jgi:formylmethanofuran dehydrogenase subunit D
VYVPTSERSTRKFPLILTTGRILSQYNVGAQTRRTANVAWHPEDLLEIHPHDAEDRGIEDGDFVTLSSRVGETRLRAKLADRMPVGVVYTTFHHPVGGANVVTTENSDWATNCPEYKVTAVQVGLAVADSGDGALKVRHILYSPKGDPSAASAVPDTDPAWTVAQLKAQAAFDKIKADPKQFDIIARAESDETQDRGDDGSGGKLPYFDPSSNIDEAFAAAIFKDGVKPGDLLPPFKSSFGWHVVQVMYAPPDIDEMNKLKTQAATAGTDFGQLVRDFSDGPKAGLGGDIGWVHQGQLDDRLTAKILATPVGSFTDIIDLAGDGLYLFKVTAEKTAAPDADQLKTITANAFSNWYAGKKAAVTITRDILGA